ncbi:NAD(P)-dependent oxidoreductase [Maritalea mediterranea]|uniref:precorrin-2 dehydrogenase n=1 Tax=Maritalea mediterranea TaxID=2909667 RepID=A0ABS9E5H6_9HYPH|nr:NAD(P)-dependent oxidoreductase [Maritalea mediterranea]MCF4098123.1 siroheme synthase [Maritalea mediterranea]
MNLPFLSRNKIEMASSGHRASGRIGKLSVLPVFFDLTGENILVIGGTDAASWKAELLAAAGAHVLIHAPEISPAFQRLVARSPLHFSRRDPSKWDSDFANVKLIICDAADAAEAKRVRSIASLYGLPVNIIDQPEYCDFQFGSIVNRSPLVIGISTHGAAPILGQAVRRRIEAILPAALNQWAALAQKIRHLVMTHLPMGEKRRAFWEHFVDHAFSEVPGPHTEAALKKHCLALSNGEVDDKGKALTMTRIGYCVLDPELVTLKAVRAMQAADMVLHDRHTPQAVLDLARREAEHVLIEDFRARDHAKLEARNIVQLVAGQPCLFERFEGVATEFSECGRRCADQTT